MDAVIYLFTYFVIYLLIYLFTYSFILLFNNISSLGNGLRIDTRPAFPVGSLKCVLFSIGYLKKKKMNQYFGMYS